MSDQLLVSPATKPRKAEKIHEDGVAAVDRALSIMAVFEASEQPLSLAELSRRSGFYKSTLLRLIASLERFGYISRIGDNGYRLGPAAFKLGLAYDRTFRLADHVLPVLNDLVRQGTESSSFHVRQDDKTRLCLFRVDSAHSTLDHIRPGDVLPLRRGAAGRILLAVDQMPAKDFDQAAKSNLLAISFGERDPVCAGLAAPVFGADGRVTGALSLSGPRVRFTDEAVRLMSSQLLRAAITITSTMGGPVALLQERLARLDNDQDHPVLGTG